MAQKHVLTTETTFMTVNLALSLTSQTPAQGASMSLHDSEEEHQSERKTET